MSLVPAKRKPSRRRPTRPTPKPKPVKPRPGIPPFLADDIKLVRTKGTPGRGDGPGGEAWRIEAKGKRAGIVFINVIEEPPLGNHASIQIYLSRPYQGRRIGRVAYRVACQMSQHEEIFAHMRKSNDASRRAAEEAGFVDVTPPELIQLIMKRHRTAE
jgi:acetyltransferase (GNAT) family protein